MIRDVSFKVAPGEKLAIVGHTGAGKTTIINLLMRFYEPQRGRILVDGIPIADLSLRQLRDRIGLVLQDIFLFSQSVEYNVRLGDGKIDTDAVAAALDAVGATPFVERLPERAEQALGERGASLSVGERQLLSFARALAFDPAILVLDEATSSVDSEIEARIEETTLVYAFSVPLAPPLDPQNDPVTVSLFDPENFVDFNFRDSEFLLVSGAMGAGCKFRIARGKGAQSGHPQPVTLACEG